MVTNIKPALKQQPILERQYVEQFWVVSKFLLQGTLLVLDYFTSYQMAKEFATQETKQFPDEHIFILELSDVAFRAKEPGVEWLEVDDIPF